jgi:O-antigen/teichoic acid export membrane protein
MTAAAGTEQTLADARHRDTMGRLARGGTLNMIGAAVSGASGILVVLFVTRTMPAPVAGAFFAATSIFLILVAVIELGVDTGLVRFLPRNLVERRLADIRTTFLVALTPVVVLAVVAAVALFLGAGWIAEVAGGDADVDQLSSVLRMMALFLPLAAVTDLSLAGTQGFGSMRPAVLVDKIGRTGLQLVTVGVACATGAGLVALSLGWAGPYLLAAGAGLVALRSMVVRRERRLADTVLPTARTRREVGGEFWRYTTPRAVARISQVALQRADIILVAALRGPRDAAIYTAATRFLVLGQLGTVAMQQVLAPNLSRLLTEGHHDVARKAFQATTAWLVAMAWPIYLACAVLGPLLLTVFGHGYEAGQTTVLVLCLTMLLATAAGPVDVALLMSGRSGLSLANNLVALTIDIALDFVLIPKYGVTGAAIAWSIALLVRNLLPFLQVRHLMGIVSLGPGFWYVAASAAACFGLLPLVTRLAFGLSASVAVPTLAVACLVYAGLLWRGRVVLELTAFAGLVRSRRRAVRPLPEN